MSSILSPKEQAQALFDSMKGFRVKHSHSLKCAINAVDEIIKQIIEIEFYRDTAMPSLLAYWEDVKKELKNFKK